MMWLKWSICLCRSSPPEVLLGKVVLEIYSKFSRDHQCRSVISIKFLACFCDKRWFNLMTSNDPPNCFEKYLHEITSKWLIKTHFVRSCFLTETVCRRCSIKNKFLKISQNFVGVSFLVKLEANMLKVGNKDKVSSYEFCQIFKNTFFIAQLRWLLLFLPISDQ